MPPPTYGDGKSENPRISIGDRGDAAHAYSALSFLVYDDAETPIRTLRSIALAVRAAAMRYDSHRATVIGPSARSPAEYGSSAGKMMSGCSRSITRLNVASRPFSSNSARLSSGRIVPRYPIATTMG